MRGDIMFRIYGVHGGRKEDTYLGVFRTKQEAIAEVEKLSASEINGLTWASQYHNRGFEIREAAVDTDFEIPSHPAPRERYCIRVAANPVRPGAWNTSVVEVLRRGANAGDFETVCDYKRNHTMFETFEPFRQGARDFALISRDYTTTAVLDLGSGAVVAEEGGSGSSESGFCPVGFYVPDWWDVNDASTLPASTYWTTDCEWPIGAFGFVWGCIWGDDSSWKVQYLDLSRIQQGIIVRDQRFGYVELATHSYQSPCMSLDPPAPGRTAPPFIDISKRKGLTNVTFAIEMGFDLDSGRSAEWQRLKVANME